MLVLFCAEPMALSEGAFSLEVRLGDGCECGYVAVDVPVYRGIAGDSEIDGLAAERMLRGFA